MKKFLSCFFGGMLLLSPLSVWGDSDRYLGDASIYGPSNLNNPNVLIIIDNSRATLNSAAGEKYDPGIPYPDHGFDPWTIYQMDNQGGFNIVSVANATSELENLTCWTSVVKDTLLESGTYSGAGSYEYPVIKNNKDECMTGNNVGASYAIGNFLNYTLEPPAGGETKSQRRIIYESLAQVLNGARGAIKVAAMSYGGNNSGGKLLYGMTTLTDQAVMDAFSQELPGAGRLTNAADPTSWIEYATAEPLLSSNTNRPQAEALYDAGHYLGATYTPVTETQVLPALQRNICADSTHIIFITNGLPNGDASPTMATTIGDFDGDGVNEGIYGQGTHYLDDVAKKLRAEYGIITNMVLAFQASDPLIVRAAGNGEGQFHNVFNQQQLTAALNNILAGAVRASNTTFVAPVVAASPENRTTSGERIYLGFFMPQSGKGWYGNLKKFGLSDQNELTAFDGTGALVAATEADGTFKPQITTFWHGSFTDYDTNKVDSGGVGEKLLDRVASYSNLSSLLEAFHQKADARNIYTYFAGAASPSTDLTATANRVDIDNTALVNSGLISSAAGESLKAIRYLHGLDAFDQDHPKYQAVCDPSSPQYDGADPNCGFGASPYCADSTDTDCTQHVRPWVLGDILHSKPLVMHYANYNFDATTEEVCGTNKTYLFVGANDGLLHAFRDCDGKEVWAFAPPGLLPYVPNLQDQTHSYFVDGTPVAYIHDTNYDGNITLAGSAGSLTSASDRVILIFGTRRGEGLNTLPATGSRGSYYALDVSDPTHPIFLWQINNETSDFGELGETWSTPRLAKIKVDVSGVIKRKIVAFIGAGYDNNEDLRWGNTQTFPDSTNDSTIIPVRNDPFTIAKTGGTALPYNPKGRGIYAIEIATLEQGGDGKYYSNFANSGTKVWGYTHANDSSMNFSIPSDVTPMDSNIDGFVDRLYVGDTGGQLWRFEVGNINPGSWTAKKLFVANPSQTNSGEAVTTTGRKIFYRPSVARLDHQHTMVFFGTGDRPHPINYLNAGSANGAVVDRLYAVRDDANNSVAGALNELHLENVTTNILQQDIGGSVTQDLIDELRARLTRRFDPVAGEEFRYGWFIKLDEHDGEKSLSQPLFYDETVFFTTYSPYAADSNNLDPCTPGNQGTARLYALHYLTGEAVFDFFTAANGSDPHGESQSTANNSRAGTPDENGSFEKVFRRSDRFKALGSGIPPGPTLIDNKIFIPSDEKFPQIDVGNSGTIHPIYWMQR